MTDRWIAEEVLWSFFERCDNRCVWLGIGDKADTRVYQLCESARKMEEEEEG